jgi:hypothetical protein
MTTYSVLLFSVLLLPVNGAANVPVGAGHSASTAESIPAVPSSSREPPKAAKPNLSATESSVAQASSENQNNIRLQEMQTLLSAQIAALKPSPFDKWLPAIFGAIGALFGALIAAGAAAKLQAGRLLHEGQIQRERLFYEERSQAEKLRHEELSAERAIGHHAMAEIMAFRSKQLNEFYGPLEALLKQGLVLRDEFYRRLESTQTEKPNVTYRWQSDDEAATGKSLWIKRDGSDEVAFRMIDEMKLINDSYPQLLPNVAEIVRVGDLIVAHVHSRIGLVLPDSTDSGLLSDKLGIFLAHQSVLKEVFGHVDDPVDDPAKDWSNLGYSASFPRGLDALVKKDSAKLRRELTNWEIKVRQWTDMPALTEPGVVQEPKESVV